MTHPLKVVHVVGSLARAWGGLSAYVAGLASEQEKLGASVVIISSDRDDASGLVSVSGIDRRYGTRDAVSALVADADIVHVHGLWIPLCHAAAKAARKHRTPYIVSVHGMLEPAALAIAPWKKKVAHSLYQRRDLAGAAALHGTTEVECETIRRHGIQSPVIVLPPGIEPHASFVTKGPSAARVAVFLGRIHPIKGIDLLIDAWTRVSPSGWKLSIAGPGEPGHLKRVQKQIVAAAAGPGVEYVGPLFDAEKEAFLQQASLMIQPSATENFGISIAEGLSYGVPVITTVGTPWKSLMESQCGWWVPRDIDSIAAAIREATQLPRAELDAMAARGQRMCRERFCWTTIAERMLESYTWAIRREGRSEWGDAPRAVEAGSLAP